MKLNKILLIISLIIIMLFNLVVQSSFAANDENGNFDITKPMNTSGQEEGRVEIKNEQGESHNASITGTTNTKAQTFKPVSMVLVSFPLIVNDLMGAIVNNLSDGKDSFTIYDVVMGHYNLFNIDFTGLASTKINSETDLIYVIRTHVIKYYNLTRNISIALSLFVLIYIGIRMAISTVASDRARYKKMLLNWLIAFILLFVIHFIIIIISYVLQIGLDIIENVAKTIGEVNSFENDIYSNALVNLNTSGFNVFPAVILVYMITWYQAKFFLYYMKRTLEVNFLVIVSPLVTVTYPIDKTGDGKAQAFNSVIKELILKSLIQLVHALVYVVFIATAGLVAKSQPILAIIFFAALSRAERIIRNIFGVDEKGFEKTSVPFIKK